jgi:hypothetical protein
VPDAMNTGHPVLRVTWPPVVAITRSQSHPSDEVLRVLSKDGPRRDASIGAAVSDPQQAIGLKGPEIVVG